MSFDSRAHGLGERVVGRFEDDADTYRLELVADGGSDTPILLGEAQETKPDRRGPTVHQPSGRRGVAARRHERRGSVSRHTGADQARDRVALREPCQRLAIQTDGKGAPHVGIGKHAAARIELDEADEVRRGPDETRLPAGARKAVLLPELPLEPAVEGERRAQLLPDVRHKIGATLLDEHSRALGVAGHGEHDSVELRRTRAGVVRIRKDDELLACGMGIDVVGPGRRDWLQQPRLALAYGGADRHNRGTRRREARGEGRRGRGQLDRDRLTFDGDSGDVVRVPFLELRGPDDIAAQEVVAEPLFGDRTLERITDGLGGYRLTGGRREAETWRTLNVYRRRSSDTSGGTCRQLGDDLRRTVRRGLVAHQPDPDGVGEDERRYVVGSGWIGWTGVPSASATLMTRSPSMAARPSAADSSRPTQSRSPVTATPSGRWPVFVWRTASVLGSSRLTVPAREFETQR